MVNNIDISYDIYTIRIWSFIITVLYKPLTKGKPVKNALAETAIAIPLPPRIEDVKAQFPGSMDRECLRLTAYLAKIFAVLGIFGAPMLEWKAPLKYDAWQALMDWTNIARYFLGDELWDKTFHRLVVERGIKECLWYFETTTTRNIITEAKQSKLLRKRSRRFPNVSKEFLLWEYCLEDSTAGTWIRKILYELEKFDHSEQPHLAQVVMGGAIVPLELLLLQLCPKREAGSPVMRRCAALRFRHDLPAQEQWCQNVVDHIYDLHEKR